MGIYNFFKFSKEADKGNEGGSPEEDYPKVPEPSPSAKKKRNKALEEDKKAKIHKGFYQVSHQILSPINHQLQFSQNRTNMTHWSQSRA